MALYKFGDEKLEPVSPTTFIRETIRERAGIQDYLKNDISPLGDDLFVLKDEFNDWEDSNRRIDLLCLNKDRGLVVIELKRTEDGGHMDLQAIRYAAMVSGMVFSQAINAYARMTGLDIEEAKNDIYEFLEAEKSDEIELTGEVSIILASANFSVEITTTVMWLNTKYGLGIKCIRLNPYKYKDEVLLDVEQIIPLPEAAPYLTKLREREEGEHKAKVINKKNVEKKSTEFWVGFYESNEKFRALFPRRAGGSSYVQTSSLKQFQSGLQLSCQIVDSKARVYVYIETKSKEDNARIFQLLESKRDVIQAELGFDLTWDSMPGRLACKIYVDRLGAGLGSEQENWPEIYEWMSQTAIKMDKVFTQVVSNLGMQPRAS